MSFSHRRPGVGLRNIGCCEYVDWNMPADCHTGVIPFVGTAAILATRNVAGPSPSSLSPWIAIMSVMLSNGRQCCCRGHQNTFSVLLRSSDSRHNEDYDDSAISLPLGNFPIVLTRKLLAVLSRLPLMAFVRYLYLKVGFV